MSEVKTDNIRKLTPTSNAELGIYDEQLTFALSDPDVRNIALSGPYGAGKSSILATYKRKHPEKKFLHISFAHFQDGTKNDGQLPNETRLEGKIINQLIHQMPAETIPQTHFQLLKEVDRGKIQKYIYWSVVLTALLVFIFFHDAWCRLVDSLSLEFLRSLLELTQPKEAVLAATVICVVLAVQGLTEYIYLQRNQRILRKVNLKGANLDIELFNAESDSYFDRYLNEVLYLFDHVDVDAVVFEDIDRYDRNLIFERLREINMLANRIREQGISEGTDQRKKPLRFLYLIRDDVFSSKDRTKFFDMIIPIVPVMDGSNSYALLIRLFGQIEEEARPGDDFLRGVSLYIDDMRLLGNIYNEYLVYYRKYQQNNVIELNADKLLAMMVYKNLFPEDHSMLHQGRGYVYTLFHNKPQFVEGKRKELREELGLLERQLEDIRWEAFQNMDELDAAYYLENRQTRIPTAGGGKEVFESGVAYVAAVKANSYDIEYYSEDGNRYYAGWVKENVKEKFDKLMENPEYQKHKQRIEEKADAEGIRQRITEIRSRIEHLESMSLRDIINDGKADQIFGAAYMNVLGEEEPYAEIKRSCYFSLIPFLVRNGYIDESYQDYMSYFYSDGLHREDKVFLRSLLEHNYKGAGYHLEEPCKVISWMHNSQFEAAECLNYQLLDALLQIVYHPGELQGDIKRQDIDYEDRLKRIAEYIIRKNNKEFLEGFLWQGRYSDDFIGHINSVHSNTASWILTDENLEDLTKYKYAMYTMLHNYCSGDEADLKQLAEYVGRNTKFLYAKFTEEEYANFVAALSRFKVKFDSLSLAEDRYIAAASHTDIAQERNGRVLQYVYSRNLYAVNIENVVEILHLFYGMQLHEINSSMLITQINKKENEPLKRYIDENMEELLEALTASGIPLDDEKENILSILNKEDLSLECKENYMAALIHKENISLSEIPDKALWPGLMNGHIKPNMTNVAEYYFWQGGRMDETLINFINSAAKFEKLGKPAEKEIIAQYGEDKTKQLYLDILGCNAISGDTYKGLAGVFSFRYAAENIGIIDENKMQLLISRKIIEMTLDNLQYIRRNYPRLTYTFIKKNISEYMILSEIGSEGYQEEEFIAVMASDRGILDDFLSDRDESRERKKKVLAKCVNSYKLSVLVHYLNTLKLTDFLDLLAGESLTMEQTSGNKALLDAFLSKNWIADYDIDSQDMTLYQAKGKAIISNMKNRGNKDSNRNKKNAELNLPWKYR